MASNTTVELTGDQISAIAETLVKIWKGAAPMQEGTAPKN